MDKEQTRFLACSFLLLAVEGGVIHIEVFAVHLLLGDAGTFGEALIMHNLAGPQEFDGVAHVGIIHHAQNVVVSDPRLLLCTERFGQIGQNISLHVQR